MDEYYVDLEEADLLDLPIDEELHPVHHLCDSIIDNEYDESYTGGNVIHPIDGEIRVKKKGNNILRMYIGEPENGRYYHLHIFRTLDDVHGWKNGIVIMLLQAAYYDHAKNTKRFESNKECQAVVDKLKEVFTAEDGKRMTYWEYAIQLWNKYNPKYAIPADQMPKDIKKEFPEYRKDMPDFSALKKGR